MSFVQIALVCGILSQVFASHLNHYGHGLEQQLDQSQIYSNNYHGQHGHVVDYYAYPKYKFEYGVNDPHTGDIKSQQEARDGDVVKGFYTLNDADGTKRTVHYSADKHSGFRAQVHREGHAVHPQNYHHHQHNSHNNYAVPHY